MQRSVILDVGARVLFHSVLAGSLFLLFAGHNRPGGGFIGGLVAAGGFGLRYLAGGVAGLRSASRFHPWTFLSTGLFLAVGTSAAALFAGGQVLESGKLELEMPVLGHLKATSALPFDIGVYLVVVGLMLVALDALGEEAEPEEYIQQAVT
ncbi:MAG TPA: MnhB domain-containing protein [Actinomycetota bacterium]|nr:MnhB domain-containing protein [Actinomycetota bacterium]